MATTTAKPAVKKPASTTLPKSVFDVDVRNHGLLRLAYESYLADSRQSGATTKTRGMVRGGGKKPWAQKGTGRARFGSSRNPIWRGGGIAFGPDGTENYSRRLSTTMKRTAIRQALTLGNKAGKISLVALPKLTGKTKELAEFVNKNAAEKRRVLLVVDQKSPELLRSSRNIANLDVKTAKFLSVFHLLNADAILIENAALPVIETWLAVKAEVKK